MTKLNEVISKLPQEQKERLRKKARHYYASIYSMPVLDKISKNETIRRIIKRVLKEEGLI